jgi:hypothetical protein
MAQKTASLQSIQRVAIDCLRAYMRGGDEKTTHLREAATAFVDAREHFFTPEGQPDWLGRTGAYRRWVRETFTLASVPNEDRATVQAAIRYHTGNILRDGRVDADTLEDLGLRAESPRERSTEKRIAQTATLSIFSGGQEITDGAQIVSALHLMEVALRRVSVDAVGGMDAATRTALADAAHRVYTRAKQLAEAGKKRK